MLLLNIVASHERAPVRVHCFNGSLSEHQSGYIALTVLWVSTSQGTLL